MFYDIECPVERFEHLLSSISVIVLVIVMMHPNQLSAMTNPNGQAVFSSEYPINYELPPPYCVNEGDCTNATNETAAGHYQPM